MKSDDEWTEIKKDQKWQKRFRFSPETIEPRKCDPLLKIRIIKKLSILTVRENNIWKFY